jgi:hypothetical protein
MWKSLKGPYSHFLVKEVLFTFFCYCRYLTCVPQHACVFRCAEVLILMDTACKVQPNESLWSPLLKVAFRLKNDCRGPLINLSLADIAAQILVLIHESHNLVPRAMPVRGLGWHWLGGN